MARLNGRLAALARRHGRDDEPHRERVVIYHRDRPPPPVDCCGPRIYLPCKRDGRHPCPICADEAGR